MSYQSLNSASEFTGELGRFLRGLTNKTVAIPLMFVMLFLWLNGDSLWPGYWEGGTAMAYMLMFVFAVSFTFRSSLMWLERLKFSDGIRNFSTGFLIMFAVLIVLDYGLGGLTSATISKAGVWPYIMITALFVAPVEETIFRGILREYFAGWRLSWIPLGIIITSGLFAITHFAVYGGAAMSIWWAFLMGGVFYLMATWKGVPSSTGAHTAYNLFIIGILSGGIV